MIRHIVLLKFKNGISEEQIKVIFNALNGLRNVIPGILSFSSGLYQSREGLNKGYTHCFVMKFKDEVERDKYLEHPEHKRVAEKIVQPALEDGLNSVIAFDYEKSSKNDQKSIQALIASRATKTPATAVGTLEPKPSQPPPLPLCAKL